ncbi:MAG TPA: TIGR01777 family oxidoreductase [Pyrinomonadaceae bacterium]|nr:TIGR01777 family oxidoreductase [Pyrinomonadaceae bacterium]
MKVIVSGATGLVGRALVRSLLADSHEVTKLVRGGAQEFRAPGTSAVRWDPDKGEIDAAALEGHDAAVHLAGEPVAEGRWTEEKKRRIRDSRVLGTALLADALARLNRSPRVLVAASATGFYGDRGPEKLDEESAPGEDFLSRVCREWEEAARPAAEAGVRLVHLRIGVVLSGEGGALPKMLAPFKLGLGGRIGGGGQYMSWVALEDVVGVARRALEDDSMSGPYNVVAPEPVTNGEFTRALGRVLNRPTVFAAPAFALRLVYGEMADALLLSGARVYPKRLLEAGYEFALPGLEGTLRQALGRAAA